MDQRILAKAEELLDKYDYRDSNMNISTEMEKVKKDINDYIDTINQTSSPLKSWELLYLEEVSKEIKNKWVMRSAEAILKKDLIIELCTMEKLSGGELTEESFDGFMEKFQERNAEMRKKYVNTPISSFAVSSFALIANAYFEELCEPMNKKALERRTQNENL